VFPYQSEAFGAEWYLERFAKRLEAYKAQGNAAIAHIRIRTQKSP
jgi:hypothetical protein